MSSTPDASPAVSPASSTSGGLVMSSLILEPSLAATALVNAGLKKVHLPTKKMVLLGVLAGVYVALGGQVYFSMLADYDVADGIQPATGPQRFFAGFAFSFALMCILIASAELFTGNILILMAALSGRVTIKEMLWDWLVVFWSNFLGVLLMGVVIYGGGVNGYFASIDPTDAWAKDKVATRPGEVVCYAAHAKAHLRPHEMFLRAIPANILVCLAVICAIASPTAIGKIFAAGMPVAAFVTSGFEHCIANIYTFVMATLLNCANTEDHGLYWLNLLLSTLGNIVGAALLATAYWLIYFSDAQEEPVTTHEEIKQILRGHAPVPPATQNPCGTTTSVTIPSEDKEDDATELERMNSTNRFRDIVADDDKNGSERS